jgi:hypothetical protein
MANVFSSIGKSLNSATKFAPDRFRADLTVSLGLASPNRYEVNFPGIDGMSKPHGKARDKTSSSGERNVFCTAAGMPGKQINVTQRILGAEQRPIAFGHSMPEVQFSFYLTNTYNMRHYFQEWMECCTSQGTDEPMNLGFYREYVRDIKVRQYTRNARRVYEAKLIDAFPTNISTIELNNQLQTQAHEFTVSMAYRTYVTDQTRG